LLRDEVVNHVVAHELYALEVLLGLLYPGEYSLLVKLLVSRADLGAPQHGLAVGLRVRIALRVDDWGRARTRRALRQRRARGDKEQCDGCRDPQRRAFECD